MHLNVPELCNDKECFDEILLNQLEQRVSATGDDLFIVLHQKGSHGASLLSACSKSIRKIHSGLSNKRVQNCSQQEITNAYDNTILYTDYVLDKVINFLKRQSKTSNTAMIYVSDHGESLGEKNIYLHGSPYFRLPMNKRIFL